MVQISQDRLRHEADRGMNAMSGIGNHISPRRRPPDPSRKSIDAVFGEDAPVIEGIPIEIGVGALSVEEQLANNVARVRQDDGDQVARRLILNLLAHDNVSVDRLKIELVRRGLMKGD